VYDLAKPNQYECFETECEYEELKAAATPVIFLLKLNLKRISEHMVYKSLKVE
jgi:hypothetical protein